MINIWVTTVTLYGFVAQLVEQDPFKIEVAGSSPARPTTTLNHYLHVHNDNEDANSTQLVGLCPHYHSFLKHYGKPFHYEKEEI